MRTIELTLAESAIECNLSWKVMKDITEQVADPVIIAQEVQKQIQADEAGRDYEPKIQLDTDACVKMISIASDMDEDAVGELFMEGGVMDGQIEAGKLLAAMLGGEDKEASGKRKARKKS
jgi:hypothetical protein